MDDLITLIVGAVLGFLSALLIEVARNRLESRRLSQERTLESKEEKEKNLREFLSATDDKKISPAWLTLIKTSHTLPLFQKNKTEDGMSVSLLEKLKSYEPEASETSTLEKFLLTQTQIIGRQEDCEIQLSDSTVSRLHAMVRYEDGYFAIYDLASKSGSFVNGNRVGKDGTMLRSGDRIEIGDSVFVFDGYPEAVKVPADGRKKEALTTKPPRRPNLQNRKSANRKSSDQ